MAKSTKGYLNLGFDDIVNLVIAIIPFSSWLLGGITRLLRGHIISGLIQLLTPAMIVFWILDIASMIQDKDLTFWA